MARIPEPDDPLNEYMRIGGAHSWNSNNPSLRSNSFSMEYTEQADQTIAPQLYMQNTDGHSNNDDDDDDIRI